MVCVRVCLQTLVPLAIVGPGAPGRVTLCTTLLYDRGALGGIGGTVVLVLTRPRSPRDRLGFARTLSSLYRRGVVCRRNGGLYFAPRKLAQTLLTFNRMGGARLRSLIRSGVSGPGTPCINLFTITSSCS